MAITYVLSIWPSVLTFHFLLCPLCLKLLLSISTLLSRVVMMHTPLSHVYWFCGDKVPQSGGSKQQEFILSLIRRQKSEIKVWAGHPSLGSLQDRDPPSSGLWCGQQCLACDYTALNLAFCPPGLFLRDSVPLSVPVFYQGSFLEGVNVSWAS